MSEGGEILEETEELDEKISKIPGVEFLISCLTGTKSNRRRAAGEGDDGGEMAQPAIRKGLAYFIATKTEAVEDEISKIIHDSGYHGKLTYIRPRSKNRESKEIALAALMTVVKVTQSFLF